MKITAWRWTWTICLGHALAWAGLAATAQAAGIATLTIPAAGTERAIQAVVWTPCARTAGTVQVGPLALRGVANCAPAGQGLPLIVISHGRGGTSLGHHDTATALADAGFVVAALSHPGDSVGDDGASHALAIFASRTRDMGRLITYMTTQWAQRSHLDPAAVGVFGFSRGGSTALLLAGAVPDATASGRRFCDPWWSFVVAMCRKLTSGDAGLRAAADPRIRAAVVADPLNLFGTASFKAVRVPVQLWASEQGGDSVELSHIEAIRSQLPRPPEFHIAKGAGHFAYLAPCSPALMQSAKRLCSDPKGFDRAAWHRHMNAEVIAFFRRNLVAAPTR